jgi:hypothetical protein
VATQQADASPSAGEDHQDGQAALVSLIPLLIAQAWSLLDPHDIKGTLPQFTAAVQAVVNRYGRASATAALNHYRQQRIAAGVTGPVELRVAPPTPAKAVQDAVGVATSSLYGAVTPESEQAVRDDVSEAAAQLVLDESRNTLIMNAGRDPKAKGWVRVTEPGACSFCLMLAIRAGMGALYRTKSTATMNQRSAKHATQPGVEFEGEGEFKAHDNCRCHVEPVFNHYEPSADLREAQALWVESTKGLSGNDARIAFRQAVEGRDPPPPKKKGKGKPPTPTSVPAK